METVHKDTETLKCDVPQDVSEAEASTQFESEEGEESETDSAKDDKEVRIELCKSRVVMKNGVKKRIANYSKKQACYYCNKLVSKPSKHLPAHHGNESEVMEMLALPLGSKVRRLKCKLLTNYGNFNHNKKVMERGHGSLIVSKRPSRPVSLHQWYPCPHCLGYINRQELWRHAGSCLFKEPGQNLTSVEMIERSKALLASATLQEVP